MDEKSLEHEDLDERQSQSGVQSVETAARVLNAFLNRPGPLPLKAIAAAAGMSGGKAHRYLVSLVRAGLVEQDPETARYDLGGLSLRLGLAALGRLDAVRLAAPVLVDLRDALNETVALAVWGDHGPTILRWEESTRPVTVNVRVGSTLPLLTSATGKVFLAWMDPERVAPLIEAERALAPPMADDAVEALRRQTRATGLGTVDGDLLPGVAAVSAPVFNHLGELVAALTALGHQGVFDPAVDGPVARRVADAARTLSARLGWVSSAD